MSEPYYADDLVTLYHGDCREVTEWLTADVLITDPPYGIAMESKEGRFKPGTGGAGQKRNKGILAGDETTEVRDEVLAMWGDRPAVVFGSWRMPRPARIRALLIWHKDGAYSAASSAPFFTNHEEVYVIGDGWQKIGKPLRSVITTSEHRSQAAHAVGHPTPKPIGLMDALIQRAPSGVVADPFAGSGSTLVAAKGLGRRVIGVEMSEPYCEIAAKRLAQDTLFGGAG